MVDGTDFKEFEFQTLPSYVWQHILMLLCIIVLLLFNHFDRSILMGANNDV